MNHLFTYLTLLGCIAAAPLPIMAADEGGPYVTKMPGTSFKGTLPGWTVEEELLSQRLQQHVTEIATREHNLANYSELEQAARYIEKILAKYGHAVHRQEFDAGGKKVRNLEVTIRNKQKGETASDQPPRLIVVGAHYDSAPGTPGANDNGSGVAAILELSDMLKRVALAPGIELKLVLFVNEEPPYFKGPQMGSFVHARNLYAQKRNVIAMLSLETIGYFSDEKGSQQYPPPLDAMYPSTGDFIAFVGDLGSRKLVERTIAAFRRHTAFPSEGLAAPANVPGVDWSDHWAYRQFGYPAIMITDTAPYRYPDYHRPTDTPDKIDYRRLARIVFGIEHVIRDLASTD